MALKSLPWVDHDTIRADVDTREVRFKLSKAEEYDETRLRAAFNEKGFSEIRVTHTPTALNK